MSRRKTGREKTGKETGKDAGGETGPEEAAFRPFADDAAVRVFGGLSFENGTACIAVHGALDLTRDRAGLARARALRATVEAIVAALEGQDLPEAVAQDEPAPRTVKNPFA